MPLSSSAQHDALQAAQLETNLKRTQHDLADALREQETQRQLIISLGQAFVPEAFAALSASDTDEGARRLKAMSAGEIVALIVRALGEKLAKLSAFKTGLTAEQQARWIQRVLETDATDWVSDPQFAEMRLAVESAQAAQRAAEQAARDADARARQVEAQQAKNATELLRLRGEIRTLQAQRQTTVIPQTALPISRGDSVTPMPATATHAPDMASLPAPATGTAAAPTASPREYAQTPEDSMAALVLILATRGICERPRLTEILHGEYGFGDSPNHLLINEAFDKATKEGLLDVIKPHSETGIGRAPHLVKLSDQGRAYARETLMVEPVQSELDRLLKAHDTPEHVALILYARQLFLERYPDPVKQVELFPAPVQLDGGKRSEPDLTVTLQDGRLLLIECERDTPKNAAQRIDKWSKYYTATHGEFFVVCPDAKAVSTIASEIGLWQIKHGGKVHLRVTSVNQVLTAKDPARFWVYDRPLG